MSSDDFGFDPDIDSDWQDDDPETDTTDCPSCGEQIFDDVEQCPYCGDYIVFSNRPIGPFATWVVWALIISLLLPAILVTLKVLNWK